MMYPNLGWNPYPQGAIAPATGPVLLDIAVPEYLENLRYEGKSNSTLRTYRWALRRLAKVVSQLPVDPRDVRKTLADDKLALESRRGLRRDLSAFFSWACREYGFPHPMQNLPKLPGRKTLPKVLTAEELQRLWDVTETPREQALVALTMDNGLRIGEIGGLRRPDIDVKACLVDGKTGQRRVPLSPRVRELLMQIGDGDHLWVGKRGPMTPWGVNQVYRRLFIRAGLKGRKTGPHTLRHTFATLYYANGGKLAALQQILGHTSINTTMVYVHLAGRDVDEDHQAHAPVHALDLKPMGGGGIGGDFRTGQRSPPG